MMAHNEGTSFTVELGVIYLLATLLNFI
jgi:alpha/beta superfamily hydrolase